MTKSNFGTHLVDYQKLLKFIPKGVSFSRKFGTPRVFVQIGIRPSRISVGKIQISSVEYDTLQNFVQSSMLPRANVHRVV
jgi:hypothetical protein